MSDLLLAERLVVPGDTAALLWDMDGVLLDTLGLDFEICNRLLAEHLGGRGAQDETPTVSRDFIRSIFAFHPDEFWRRILARVGEEPGIDGALEALDPILDEYEEARRTATFALNPGIAEILAAATEAGLPMAVVSNNPTADVRAILTAAGIADMFREILGNDLEALAKKPAPDTYRAAARRLGVPIERCTVVEDSPLGLEAGHRSGARVVAVATGGNELAELLATGFAHRGVERFEPPRVTMQRGHVTRKHITTPNEFVSHMVEHIAWRLGAEILLEWPDDDWHRLGMALGQQAAELGLADEEAVALGMIDDGSAEVRIGTPGPGARGRVHGVPNLDLEWFLGCRCEQLTTGRPLVELLDGLAHGLGRPVDVTVWSVEDPHHAWEGVYRSLGIALSRLLPAIDQATEPSTAIPKVAPATASGGALTVLERGPRRAVIERSTAESRVAITVDFDGEPGARCRFEVPPRLPVRGLAPLVDTLARSAGLAVDVLFESLVLSSSHVVAEDVGLVLGRALQEILVQRMEQLGVQGAGSSLRRVEDLDRRAVRVGISVEGRKIWKLIPAAVPFDILRRRFVVGQTVAGDLYSEDLDDFIDGLSGGLAASILVHCAELPPADAGWRQVFEGLGEALAEVLAPNPHRRGVPPGVKATLQ